MKATDELATRIAAGELKFATIGRSFVDGAGFMASICHGKADFSVATGETMEAAVSSALSKIKKAPPPVVTRPVEPEADIDDLDNILG